jgi:hypothetical protein
MTLAQLTHRTQILRFGVAQKGAQTARPSMPRDPALFRQTPRHRGRGYRGDRVGGVCECSQRSTPQEYPEATVAATITTATIITTITAITKRNSPGAVVTRAEAKDLHLEGLEPMKTQAAAQERKHASPDAAVEGQVTRSFTSDKLDRINAMNADARINGNAFKVATCIIQHINEKMGYAFPSVETIGIKTRLPQRVVERALTLLRKIGWLRSRLVFDRRTRTTHNLYWVLPDNMNAITDEQLVLKEAREARRNASKAMPKMWRDPPPAAERSGSDPPPAAGCDPPPAADKHLRGNT